jgi:hypothetical protein
MCAGVLLDADQIVAAWAFEKHNRVPIHVDRAIGIVEDGVLIGAALFHCYNTVDVCFAYYGKKSLSLGIIKVLARIALYELKLSRCTVIVPKRPAFLLRKLPRFGFRFEGIQRRFYGPTDKAHHTGCRFVAFREDIERLAGIKTEKAA